MAFIHGPVRLHIGRRYDLDIDHGVRPCSDADCACEHVDVVIPIDVHVKCVTFKPADIPNGTPGTFRFGSGGPTAGSD